MTIKQKIDIAFKVLSLAMGLTVTVMFGSQISQMTKLLDATERVMTATERLVELGPEAIAGVGVGISDGAQSAGDGLAKAGEEVVGRIRDALGE